MKPVKFIMVLLITASLSFLVTGCKDDESADSGQEQTLSDPAHGAEGDTQNSHGDDFEEGEEHNAADDENM